jgi:hypothetical protein
MNRFSKSSALGAAESAGQPLQHYNQPQQWPNQDPGPDADPLDGADPAGDQDDDLEADDDLPIDPPEPKGSEVPEALKAERRKTNQLEHDIRVLKRQLLVGSEFRFTTVSNGRDVLEPIDSKGNVLLSDHGNLDAASHVETLRTHPVLGFLFNQRGGLGPATVIAEFDGNGQATNLQSMSASELYLTSYDRKPAGPSG